MNNRKSTAEAAPSLARTDTESRPHGGASSGSLLEEAQALKESLREAYGRAGRLIVAIKHQRKQSKLVSTALTSLASLRELQHLER